MGLASALRIAGTALKFLGFGWVFEKTLGDSKNIPGWVWIVIGMLSAFVLVAYLTGKLPRLLRKK